MEFEALLGEITELEKANREIEQKIKEEVQRHEFTKKELNKVNNELLAQREKEIALLEKITSLQTEKDNEFKSSKQLREMIKQLKNANSAMKEQTEKEIAETKQERKFLSQTLEDVNNKYREMHSMFLKAKRNLGNEELNKESQIEQLNSDELQSLKEEIEILKKNILERDEEKRDTLKEFDSLNKFTSQLQEDHDELKMLFDAFEEWKASSCCFPCHQSIEESFGRIVQKKIE